MIRARIRGRAIAPAHTLARVLAMAATLALGSAALARAQDAAPADAGVREPSAKRLDRFEKELREVREIVLQAHATGKPVEIKEAGPDPQIVGLQTRIDDLDTQIRHLTGQIETLTHDLEQARKDAEDQRGQLSALTDRVGKLEKQLVPPAPVAGAVPAPSAAAAAPPPPPPMDAKAAYAHARQLLEDGDYAGAASELQAYIDRFGDSPTAPTARYWLGEAKFIQKDYAGAATAYLGAIRGWPKTSWAPEAVVKLSQSLLELGKPQDACGALGELERRYPRTTSTLRARAAATRAKAQCGG